MQLGPKTVKTVFLGFGLALGLAFGLGACVPFTATTVSETAIASCVSQAGYAQGTAVNVDRAFRTDGMDARVRPSADIDPGAARRINACLESSVMRQSVNYSPAPQPVTAPTPPALGGAYHQTTYTYGSQPASAQPAAPRAVATRQPAPTSHCTGGVFQGGTNYCIRN